MAIHLRQRGGIWHARGTIYADGERIDVKEFSTRYRDVDEAQRYVDQWERERIASAVADQTAKRRKADVFARTGKSDDLPPWAAAIWRKTKNNASMRGIAFDLGHSDMAALVGRAAGRCEVSGLAFDLSRVGDAVRRPFAPSIDRIRSSRGYDVGNCRLVCSAVNYALNEWGDEVFFAIAKAVARKKKATQNAARPLPSRFGGHLPKSTSRVPKCPGKNEESQGVGSGERT